MGLLQVDAPRARLVPEVGDGIQPEDVRSVADIEEEDFNDPAEGLWDFGS